MPNVAMNTGSGNQDINGVMGSYRWEASFLSFSFPTSGTQYQGYAVGEEPDTNFGAFNAVQKDVVRDVLAQYAAVSQLTFTETTGGAGTLLFGMTDNTEAAHAYSPHPDPRGGDSWYNKTSGDFDQPVRGNYGYMTFLHEVGHALGLKHGHETDSFGAMTLEHDSLEYSVMSYRPYTGASVDGAFENETFGFPQTLMMYDIAAVQHMYGANFTTNAGDSVYSWAPDSGLVTINGVTQNVAVPNRIFMTVWDGGGNDTYDLSRYNGNVAIDLRPGQWSTTSSVQRVNLGDGQVARGNIANALLYQGDTRSLIENAVGGSGNDTLTGNEANNRLDGGRGADLMTGGDGNDVYVIDNAGDRAVEESKTGGIDRVESAISFALTANIEELVLTGTAAINGTGNGLNNAIWGNAGNNRLSGGAGADLMTGGDGNDTYIVDHAGDRVVESSASGGTDKVESSVSFSLGANVETLVLTGTAAINGTGNGLDNVLGGNAGNNRLDGRGGGDLMNGGAGNDVYVVDNARDRVIEGSATGGTDKVESSVTFILGANLETLVLTGTAAINGNGNALDNILGGNSGNNRLNGGAGADHMNGGLGNDIYVVDNAGDRVIESSASGGIDKVESSVSFILGANIEKLVLTGTAAINGNGNALDNVLGGNSGNNRLNGGAGADIMNGGAGNDIYIVDNVGDRVIEGSATGGIDKVESSVSFTLGSNVENLVLTGAGAINGYGNGLDNSLTGNGAANRLAGGAGNDRLIGGAGADTFVFDTALSATLNVDDILDFSVADDTIRLDRSVFGGISAEGALSASAFQLGSAAQDADDRILYDAASGNIFYDADGTGAAAAILFAHVTPGLALTQLDFVAYI